MDDATPGRQDRGNGEVEGGPGCVCVGRGADVTGRDDEVIRSLLLRRVFLEMLRSLAATPPAVSIRLRTLIDGESKWLLAGALIVSLAPVSV